MLSEQHNAAIVQLLPVLGPLLGVAVILFVVWDYSIEPIQVATTLRVRIGLVLLGSLGYGAGCLRWTAVQRCAYIYGTHAGAMIIAASLLRDGLQFGLAGITASMFLASLVALRLSTWVLILLTPTVLFVLLSATTMFPQVFFNSILLYLFSMGVAAVIVTVISGFRRQAYLFEKKLLHSSRHDSLSGALARAYFMELALHKFALAKRHGRPLAAAMLDIDHFKCVNDNYGHAVGDVVIRQLAKVCMRNLRENDHFGRIGGEEFACVMPETDMDAAFACAERMRKSIESLRLETPRGPLQFTVSIGVGVLNERLDDWDALLREADSALYRAKASGRNCTIVAAPALHREIAT